MHALALRSPISNQYGHRVRTVCTLYGKLGLIFCVKVCISIRSSRVASRPLLTIVYCGLQTQPQSHLFPAISGHLLVPLATYSHNIYLTGLPNASCMRDNNTYRVLQKSAEQDPPVFHCSNENCMERRGPCSPDSAVYGIICYWFYLFLISLTYLAHKIKLSLSCATFNTDCNREYRNHHTNTKYRCCANQTSARLTKYREPLSASHCLVILSTYLLLRYLSEILRYLNTSRDTVQEVDWRDTHNSEANIIRTCYAPQPALRGFPDMRQLIGGRLELPAPAIPSSFADRNRRFLSYPTNQLH